MSVEIKRQEELDPAILVARIEEQMNLRGLADKLMAYPEQIRRQQEAIQAAKQAWEEAKGELQLVEGIMFAEISEQINPNTGKAAYSNEQSRKAELAKRQAESPEYQTVLKAFQEAEAALSGAQFDLDKLTNEFTAVRTVAKITAGKLELMAGLVQ